MPRRFAPRNDSRIGLRYRFAEAAGESATPYCRADVGIGPYERITMVRHKTFPWGKGDRREAVVDEGYRSSISQKPR